MIPSASHRRAETGRALERARAAHGDLAPQTWRAYGAAIAAWGEDRLAAVAPRMPTLSATFPLHERLTLVAAQKAGAQLAERDWAIREIVYWRERAAPEKYADGERVLAEAAELVTLYPNDLRTVLEDVRRVLAPRPT